jgi:hypothetical protein
LFERVGPFPTNGGVLRRCASLLRKSPDQPVKTEEPAMSPISVLTSTVPDFGLNQRLGGDAAESLLGGLLDSADAASAAAESLPHTRSGEAAVAAGACAVAGISAASAVAVNTIAAGLTVGAPIAAAAAIACAAVAAAPVLAAADGSSGLLNLLDAVRGEPRNPLLLPEPLRSMISTAA